MNEVIITDAVVAKMTAFKDANDIPAGRLISIESKLLSNSLPLEGTFGKLEWKKMSNDAFSHLRIKVVGQADDCSISTLKTLGSVGEHKAIKKGDNVYLLEVAPLNEQFSRISQLELGAYLEDRKFTAKPVASKVRPFEDRVVGQPAKQKTFIDAATCIEKADAKDTYLLTLVD